MHSGIDCRAMDTAAVVQIARSQMPRRGVKKYRGKILGRNAYLAITSSRELLHGAVYVVTDAVDDAQLVVWLRRELNRCDPAKTRHLEILPRTVAAAIDGPSAHHPEIALARVEEVQSTAPPDPAESMDAGAVIAMYPEGHIMRGVCESLCRLLDETA